MADWININALPTTAFDGALTTNQQKGWNTIELLLRPFPLNEH
jgi:hypothetical protein